MCCATICASNIIYFIIQIEHRQDEKSCLSIYFDSRLNNKEGPTLLFQCFSSIGVPWIELLTPWKRILLRNSLCGRKRTSLTNARNIAKKYKRENNGLFLFICSKIPRISMLPKEKSESREEKKSVRKEMLTF